jgi:tryptophanyl-tRNA synthetase
VPTYKEQIENLKDRDLGTYGFLGYPLLQAADIVIYDADFVPVGEDQVPHVELTREVVRRFDLQFGFETKDALFADSAALERVLEKVPHHVPELADTRQLSDRKTILRAIFRKRAAEIGIENFREEMGSSGKFFRVGKILQEPNHLLTETPRLPGLDGRRMAKSYGNAIWLSDPPDDIRAKARNMMTDPQRQRRADPGRPEICPVFAWHKLFSPQETVAQVDRECRTAAIGCVDCKKSMADNLVKWIEPIQVRRKEFEAHPQQVWDILDAGGTKARASARRTMKRVRNAIFRWDDARKSVGGK